MRIFVAVDLNKLVKQRLQELIISLRKQGGNIRWVNPDNLHLTLKFLGETSEIQIPRIIDALERTASQQSPFSFLIQGTGAYPGGNRPPRVLWAGIESQPALMSLQRELEMELHKLGFPPEKRPFSPHLTIGRVKCGSGLGGVISELNLHSDTVFGKVTAENMVLYQSRLKPSGAEYTPLHTAGLA
jgi:2'-5' RNA ligase